MSDLARFPMKVDASEMPSYDPHRMIRSLATHATWAGHDYLDALLTDFDERGNQLTAERSKNDTLSDLVTALRNRMAELVLESEEYHARACKAEGELRRLPRRSTQGGHS